MLTCDIVTAWVFDMTFSITDENKRDAWWYIDRKLTAEVMYLEHLYNLDNGYEKEKAAKQAFRKLWPSNGSASEMVAADVDAWCKANLTDKQFNSMRLALRKKASRRKNEVDSIEIDHKAYSNLNDLAAAADMSMKDYLTMLINERHEKEDPPVAYKASKRRKV